MGRAGAAIALLLLAAGAATGCGLVNEKDINAPTVDVTGSWVGSETVVQSGDNTIFPNDIFPVRLALAQTDGFVSGTYREEIYVHIDNVIETVSVQMDVYGGVSSNMLSLIDAKTNRIVMTVPVDGAGESMTAKYSHGTYVTEFHAVKEPPPAP